MVSASAVRGIQIVLPLLRLLHFRLLSADVFLAGCTLASYQIGFRLGGVSCWAFGGFLSRVPIPVMLCQKVSVGSFT